MLETIDIETASKTYKVYIGNQILHMLPPLLTDSTKVLVITDETVRNLHLNHLLNQLKDDNEVFVYTTPSGEKAKTFNIYEKCLSFAIEKGLDRKSCIIAFGGGAIGDLAGFVAATYMRGIPFFQVPTTILAHDSAVGGKVAINHSLGKNLIGSFYQPEAVVFDTQFLQSLPKQQIRSGFAELIKHALIADSRFLEQLMNEVNSIEQLMDDKLPNYLKRGIEIKADFVKQDEKETGVRAFLNFGHTLGHALETAAGYGGFTHGEAVMSGIVYALLLSKTKLHLDFDLAGFIAWIEKLGYNWQIPSSMKFETILDLMKRDKKSISNKPRFVLLQKIGEPQSEMIEKSVLKETFYIMTR